MRFMFLFVCVLALIASVHNTVLRRDCYCGSQSGCHGCGRGGGRGGGGRGGGGRGGGGRGGCPTCGPRNFGNGNHNANKITIKTYC